ncbi:selenium metabolism membrane protein YedE/FdhT [Campylobacter sp. RM12654]|uniref:selenium metabolism membrane protein YedE/FdhT n=1 Tax=unclassified Campylobacter TaxID=2593542 RepID=UPI001BD96A67|nr:selenium metabolism membrane protein YedE/FdhT [Campylobacter sp. 2018MI01]MBT0878061.1 selenium metabolism membrane protein YedE/FdhT [Campylobacter sp. 2018MI01]MBZ7977288.1 selenium metabolism membrane protein YedE/FdhT [Campylobacter sp. RM12654]
MKTSNFGAELAHFHQNYLSKFYSNTKAVMVLSIMATLYFAIFGGVFAVTGEFTRIGGEILELFGMDLSSYSYYQKQNLNGTMLTRVDGVMIIGLIIGCLLAASVANKVYFRKIASKTRFFQALIGGILAGFGARLAWGCNLANFFTGLPYFSLHTWVFAIFMCLGVAAAILVLKIKIFAPRYEMIKTNTPQLKIDKNLEQKNKIILFLSVIAFFVFFAYLASNDTKNLPTALIFGVIFGWLIQKGQICFTSCFRDLFLFKRYSFSLALFVSMLVASIFVFALLNKGGYNAKVLEISLGLCTGAFIFGFGIVFAGGCECGFLYRAVEGQTHFIVVGIGNIIGTMLIALNYDLLPKWFLSGEKIKLSGYSGLGINIALFLISIALILFYARRKNEN